MKALFLSFTILMILLVSGCSNFCGDSNLSFLCPGGPQTEKLGPDVLTIENIEVIPRSNIRPEDQFSVFFEVRNHDENELIIDTSYYLYDTGVCDFLPIEGDPNPTNVIDLGDFAPKEVKLIEWNFKAPKKEEIAGLSVNCPIRFKVSYNYIAKSQIDVVVIDSDRLTELQRSGNEYTYSPNLMIGRGPLKVYFDFANTLPVRENTNLTFYLKVVDEGAGTYDKIPSDTLEALTVKAPEFDNLDCISDYFACTKDQYGPTCVNTVKEIPLINKETFDIRCTAETPDVGEMERTYYITAGFTYDYDVLGQTNVQVKP